jgi:metal-sulfur cluster biosynthetic enzyme
MPDTPENRHAAIIAELDAIHDPCSVASGTPMGLAEMGMVDRIDISPQGHVAIGLKLTSPFCHMIGFFKTEVQRRVAALPGIASVSLSADNGLDWSPDRISPAAQARRAARLAELASNERAIITGRPVPVDGGYTLV